MDSFSRFNQLVDYWHCVQSVRGFELNMVHLHNVFFKGQHWCMCSAPRTLKTLVQFFHIFVMNVSKFSKGQHSKAIHVISVKEFHSEPQMSSSWWCYSEKSGGLPTSLGFGTWAPCWSVSRKCEGWILLTLVIQRFFCFRLSAFMCKNVETVRGSTWRVPKVWRVHPLVHGSKTTCIYYMRYFSWYERGELTKNPSSFPEINNEKIYIWKVNFKLALLC